MFEYAFIGVGLYILRVWFVWSNKKDEGRIKTSLKKTYYRERQEIVVTVIGAIIFAWLGEGILDSVCDVVGYFSSAHDLCVSIQVNVEEILYMIGGATFGSIGIIAVKVVKTKAKKKLGRL